MPATDQTNIRAQAAVDVMWDNTDVVGSLRAIRKNAEEEGQKTIDWYWRNKHWKSRLSRGIQLSALVLTALAGILPVVVQVVRSVNTAAIPNKFDSGAVSTLCVGLAAALIGLDRAFGFSSGWTRYVLTATSMTKQLHEFRMDWVSMIAASSVAPKPVDQTKPVEAAPSIEDQVKLIQRAKDFISSIQAMVLQETKDWATEFQSNMAQMEKDLKTQLDSLKAQVDQAIKDKETASKPAAIELTVTNADKTDGFTFNVTLEGTTVKFNETVANSKVWARINTPPGQYRLTVDAKKGGPIGTSMILEVKPGETAKESLTLPIS
jgi:hypothetical protein